LTIRPLTPVFVGQSPFLEEVMTCHDGFLRRKKCQVLADSVEKVGFSNGLNSGTTTTGEPTHHIEWFFGPSVTFAALLLG
jgi:hypothetical protein